MYSYIQCFLLNSHVYFSSCLYELCFQLAIIMLAKQLIQVLLLCTVLAISINAKCSALCVSFLALYSSTPFVMCAEYTDGSGAAAAHSAGETSV